MEWGSRCPHNKAICQGSGGPSDAYKHSFESQEAGAENEGSSASIDGPDVEL